MGRAARFLVGLFVLVAFLGEVRAEIPGANSTTPAATEYRALRALRDRSPPPGVAKMSEEEQQWWATRNLELHERGLAFWQNFPADPLRWDVVNLLATTPIFMKDAVEDGRTTQVRDYDRQRAWSARYREWQDELLAAPDAGPSAKQSALSFLLTNTSVNWRNRIRTPEGQAMLAKMEGWYARWVRDYPDSLAIINGVRAMAEALDKADPARCGQFLLALPAQFPADTRRDREIRQVAEGRLKTLLGQAYPVWLHLYALDGKFADTQEYRGKMVLIALFPLAWADQAEWLRTVYDAYHARGLEIIHVTGGEAMVQGAAPRTTLETALAADEKKYPWRVVWDTKGTIGEFEKTFGLNGYPAFLLLARDGRIVTEQTSPRALVSEIERELALP